MQTEVCNFIKKDTLAEILSCKFAKFLRTLFYRTAPGYCFCHWCKMSWNVIFGSNLNFRDSGSESRNFILNNVELKVLFLTLWSCDYYYCSISSSKAWTKVLHRFKSFLQHVGDFQWWQSLTMDPAGNKN